MENVNHNGEHREQGDEMRHYWDEFIATSDRILFLQGPIGPFFTYLAVALEAAGKQTFKLNFNGGDSYYATQPQRGGQVQSFQAIYNYKGTPAHFKAYLIDLIQREQIDSIVCFGDKRRYHQIACEVVVAQNRALEASREGNRGEDHERQTPAPGARKLTFWVFEEGYLRPHYITFEKWGVNYNSRIARNTTSTPAFIELKAADNLEKDLNRGVTPVAAGFWRRAKIAIRYYWEMYAQRAQFPRYQHHRETRLLIYSYAWLRAGIKQLYYGVKDYRIANKIRRGEYGDFFLFPLQVHNDSQILQHGRGRRLPVHIRQVIASFGKYAAPHDRLVIKHHPMDKGFNDFTGLIKRLAKKYGVEERVDYLFEVPMPTLLRSAKGVVVINSTSGLSALIHNLPVKVIGDAHYDNPYLTNQCTLDQFWQEAYQPNSQHVKRYLYALKFKSQLNGSFYYEKQLMLPEIKFSENKK